MGKRYDELEAQYAGKYPRMPAEWFAGPVQQVLRAAYAEVPDDLDSHTTYVLAHAALRRAREDVRDVLEDVMHGYSTRWAKLASRPRFGICSQLVHATTMYMLSDVAAWWPHARRCSDGFLTGYYCTVDDHENNWEGANFFVRTLLLREFLKVIDMAIKEVANAE